MPLHPRLDKCSNSCYTVAPVNDEPVLHHCLPSFDTIAVQATLLHLHASDRSRYYSKVPKIFGCYSVPRLAQVMTIDSLTVRVDHSQTVGLLVSGRLFGAAARGWPGESGNIISRSAQRPTCCPACLCAAELIMRKQFPAVC